ncbi:MAG: oxidoreductase, partial [Chloroflexota bacterium]
MFDTGARAHFVASRFAVPIMLPHRQGIIITTGYPTKDAAECTWLAAIPKVTANGLTQLMAHQLREHAIAAVTVAPTGWVWDWETLQVVNDALRTLGGVDALYRDKPDLQNRESPEYTGRAVAMLAADPDVLAKSGRVLAIDDLAREYGFT